MLGEFSNVDGRGRSPKTSVIGSAGTRRGAVAGLQRRVRARDEVPSSGQIVLRSANQILR